MANSINTIVLEKTFDVAAQFQQVYLQKVCKRLMDRMKNF